MIINQGNLELLLMRHKKWVKQRYLLSNSIEFFATNDESTRSDQDVISEHSITINFTAVVGDLDLGVRTKFEST